MPLFSGKKGQMKLWESMLRFEQLSQRQKWPKSELADRLLSYCTDDAWKALSSVHGVDMDNEKLYQKYHECLESRYGLTPIEAYTMLIQRKFSEDTDTIDDDATDIMTYAKC